MCLPIAVAPGSLRILFAAPFKERLKAHLICKAPQFPKNPTSLSTFLSTRPPSSRSVLVAFLAKLEGLRRRQAVEGAPHSATELAEPSGDSPVGYTEGTDNYFLVLSLNVHASGR